MIWRSELGRVLLPLPTPPLNSMKFSITTTFAALSGLALASAGGFADCDPTGAAEHTTGESLPMILATD